MCVTTVTPILGATSRPHIDMYIYVWSYHYPTPLEGVKQWCFWTYLAEISHLVKYICVCLRLNYQRLNLITRKLFKIN